MELRLVLYLIPFSFLLFSAIGLFVHAEKPFFGSFSAIFLGLLSLVILNTAGTFTGVFVPISALTLFVCTVGGIPAAVLMFAAHAFLL